MSDHRPEDGETEESEPEGGHRTATTEEIVAGAYRKPPRAPLILIGVLVAVFLLQQLLPAGAARELVIALAFLTTTDGEFLPLRFYTFITHALLHFNLPHILFNSIAILTAGTVACRFLGTGRFLALVMACAIAGAAAHALLNWGAAYALGGASGVAFGMWGAGAYFWVYRSHEPMRVRVGKVAYYVALMMGLNFLYAYAVSGSGAFGMTGDVSWEAHAGGFLAGFLLFPLLRRGRSADR